MHNRRLVIIFMIVLVDMLSFSIILPLLPYLAKSLGATGFQIGLLGAAYPFAQLFGAPFLGRLSDRVGRKPVLIVSIAGTLIGFVVLATARLLPVLFVSRFVDGITGGNISVAQAYISDITSDEDRGRAFGLIGAAFGLGFILGPVIGGLLSSYGYALPAFVGAALAALNIVLILIFVPESLTAEDKARLSARHINSFDFRALRKTLSRKRVGPLLWMRLITATGFTIFESGFALWAIFALGLTVRTTAFIFVYIGLLATLIQFFLIGQLTKRFKDDHLIVASSIIGAIALVSWGITPNLLVLIVVLPFLSIAISIANTIIPSALTKSVDNDEVGGILGLNTVLQSFAKVPAPVIAGALIQYVNVWSPGVLSGVVLAGMSIYAFKNLYIRRGVEHTSK